VLFTSPSSAVIAAKTGATELLKIYKVILSMVSCCESGLLNVRTWPRRNKSGTCLEPGAS
jgi:hypothetical protein